MLDLLIVSGASKGIGASIVKKCTILTKKIIAISSSDNIYDLSLDKDISDVSLIKSDLSDYNKTYSLVVEELSKIKNIKSVGIILCGGQIGNSGGLLSSNISDWDHLYKCNLLGNLSIVKACGEIIKFGKSRIIFMSGGGAAFPYVDFSGYALSKVATVRAVENLSLEFSEYDSSVVALAPGAVKTDILDIVLKSGSKIRTFTDISEPTNFAFSFLNDQIDVKKFNGSFLHVRDDLNCLSDKKDLFKLRRIE